MLGERPGQVLPHGLRRNPPADTLLLAFRPPDSDYTFLLSKQPGLWCLLRPPWQTNMPAYFLGVEFVIYRIYKGTEEVQCLVGLEICMAPSQSILLTAILKSLVPFTSLA